MQPPNPNPNGEPFHHKPKPFPPGEGNMASILKNRVLGETDDYLQTSNHHPQQQHLYLEINRSSSAPPTQAALSQLPSNNDPRANPEYAAFYYNHSRLDPRLPPPIYEPGQSWQMWSSGLSGHSPSDFEKRWQSSGGIASNGVSPLSNSQQYSDAYVNHQSDSALLRLQESQQQKYQRKSPPISPPRRRLVEMIQDDFPRTPSPVFGMQQQQLQMDAEDYLRFQSKTPPVSHLPQHLHHLQNQLQPPRSSSTPPLLNGKISSRLMRPNADIYLLEQQQQLWLEQQQQQQEDEDLIEGMRHLSHQDYYPARQPRYAPAPQVQHQPMKSDMGDYYSNDYYSNPSPQQQQQQYFSPPPGMYRRPPTNQSSPVSGKGGLLEEFRLNKQRKWELRDLAGYMMDFSTDQHGSRFIQQKLEISPDADKQLVFGEILPNALQLMSDVFGNYVIQKFLEYGTDDQKRQLGEQMKGHVLQLSLQMYGCRVVQKALEHLPDDQQMTLIHDLQGHFLKCVKDQNGNHVIQKVIEKLNPEKLKFMMEAFQDQIFVLATHPYGCRVMQRLFEYCTPEQTKPIVKELKDHIETLVQDQYGNYVVQHILEKGGPEERHEVIVRCKGQFLNLSKHKFASNVIEKCVIYSSEEDRHQIIEETVTARPDGTMPLLQMMKDQYANYVVQKMLDLGTKEEKALLISRIKPHMSSLKKFNYGKHILNKVEKILMEWGQQ